MKIVRTKFYEQLIVVSDYILLGILWVIAYLPVITIVPATCAVFYIIAQQKDKGSGRIIYLFFQGMKQHFGKNLLLSMLTTVIYFLVNQLSEEQAVGLSISGYVVSLIYSMFLLSWVYVISENEDTSFLQISEQNTWKVFFDFLRNILCCALLLGFVLLIFLFSPFIFISAGGVWKLVSIILTIGDKRQGRLSDEGTRVKIRGDFTVGKINSRLFDSFIEHMGDVICTGICKPSRETADGDGFRRDALSYVKELELGVIRCPGGSFTSSYDWLDTIDRKERRPKKTDLAWRGIEPDSFGIHEFFKWISHVQAEPIFTMNLGTEGISEAKNLVEYCNFPKGTHWSGLRVKNGQKKPFDVKLWCLGNELDGLWQVGAKSAYEYSRLANEASKVMKLIDNSIETILVGSSTPRLPSCPEWGRIALEETYEDVDYLVLHNYIDKYGGEDLTKPPKNEHDNTATYLAEAYRFDCQTEEIVATCDYVEGYLGSEKIMYPAFDGRNVHAQPEKRRRDFEIGSPIDWCCFTMEDTLLLDSLGLAILRHADRVKIGCQSLLVSTIPLILTDVKDQARKNPTYYVV